MKKAIPTWVTVVAGLITLLGLFVGASLYLSPGSFIPDINFSSPDIQFLTNMWAARQVAIAAVIGYAVIKQAPAMLQISLAAYGLMNVQDVVIGLRQNDSGLSMGATVFSVRAISMIVAISRRTKYLS